jgi:hypothetical protein
MIKRKNRKIHLLMLAISWLLPALACNLPTLAPTTEDLFVSTRTPISTFTLAPTTTRIQPSATSPASASPTATTGPTPTFSPGFNESFDTDLSAWNDLFILTTQASGGRIQTSLSQRNGMLTFNLDDKETYLYRFHKAPQQADIYVNVEYRIEGQKENQVGLVCRAAADQSSWYEARISGTGVFQIYYYSRARKTQENLNPFVPLLQNSANEDAFTSGQMNLVRFTCRGNKLTLDLNQGKQIFEVEDNRLQGGGLVGFGAMTYTNLPATLQIEEVNAGVP